MRPRIRIALVLLGWTLAIPALAVDEAPGGEDQDPAGGAPVVAVHLDTGELVDGAVEAVRAYLLEDAPAMRSALDRMERSTRRLDRERDAALGPDLLTYEQAFHETLDRAREMSLKGNLEEAFNQFVWTQRACVTCHRIAREQGRMAGTPD